MCGRSRTPAAVTMGERRVDREAGRYSVGCTGSRRRRILLLSAVCTATGDQGDAHGPCCYQEPCGSLGSRAVEGKEAIPEVLSKAGRTAGKGECKGLLGTPPPPSLLPQNSQPGEKAIMDNSAKSGLAGAQVEVGAPGHGHWEFRHAPMSI